MEANNNTVFNELLEKYNLSRVESATNPHGQIVDDATKKYNPKAHDYLEAKRVEMDILLAKMVQVKGDKITFVSVQKDENTYHLVYDPFDEDVKQSELSFDIVPAAKEKKGALIYQRFANGGVDWYYRVLDGPVEDIFMFKLGTWIESAKYKTHMDDFCNDVSKVLRFCPHKDCHAYSVYLEKFVLWFQTFEDCPITLGHILEGLMGKLKYIFFKKDWEKFESKGTLDDEIFRAHTAISIQDCSNKCHKLFKKLDFKAEKSINALRTIMRGYTDALAVRNAKIAQLSKAAAPKRKIDQVEKDESPDHGEDDGSNKMRKLEDGSGKPAPSSKSLLGIN